MKLTYFGFLRRFVLLPILLMRLLEMLDRRRRPASLQGTPVWDAVAAHALIALTYTTPWDNYLVATRVWWYDRKRVTGLVFGWVPIEEYTFFVLQPLLTGSWLHLVARYAAALHLELEAAPPAQPERFRALAVGGVGLGWLVSVAALASRQPRSQYMGLLFAWSLPPLLLQLAFGADILWRRRWLVLASLVPSTLYLGAADRFAIGSGNWTINPAKTVGIKLFGKLPLEEFLFFLMTNALIVSGVTLLLDRQSRERAAPYLRALDRLARWWRSFAPRV